MISVNRRTLYGEVYNDVRCLSSDEKPTEGIKNGSTLIEIDTGKRYLYDALSGSWNEFSQGGGGGGEYVLPTMSQSVKGGATLGEGLSMSGDSLSVDYSKVASKQSLDDATEVDPDGGLKRTTNGLSADYSKVASVESLESATKLEADGGIKRTSNGLSVDYSDVASMDALEDATALSPTGGIVSTQDGLAISPTQSSTGAIDGALLELTAKSKPATQQTTTGKNLLDESAIERGTITNSGDAESPGNRYRTSASRSIAVSAGDTVVVSGAVLNGEFNAFISVYNSKPVSTTPRDDNSGWLTSGQSYTIPGGGQYVRLTFRRSDDTNVNRSDFSHIQLELGSTATPYEPYTGGAPSPSPDFPQPIVTVRGRNLWDESKNVDGEFVTSNGVTTNSNYGHSDYIAVKPNTTYYVNNVVGSSSQVTAIVYDSSKSYLRGASIQGQAVASGAIDFGENAAYVRINYRDISSDHQLTDTPQPYVPYGHVGLEATANVTFDETTLIRNAGTGVLTRNSTSKSYIAHVSRNTYYRVVYVGGNRCNISGTGSSYPTSGMTASALFESSTVHFAEFNSGENDYILLHLATGATVSDVRLLLDTTPIPLPSRGWVAGLPDGTADELSVDGAGKVMWTEKTGILDLAGLTWQYSISASAISPYFFTSVANTIAYEGDFNSVVYPAFAENFIIVKRAPQYMTDGRMCFDGSIGTVWQIQCKSSSITTVVDFMAMLGDSSLLLYKLATPVTEDCGYIEGWTNDFSEGCVLSIPELDALGVRYTIGDGAEIARQWYQRAHSEYEQRITDLEEAVAELTAGA